MSGRSGLCLYLRTSTGKHSELICDMLPHRDLRGFRQVPDECCRGMQRNCLVSRKSYQLLSIVELVLRSSMLRARKSKLPGHHHFGTWEIGMAPRMYLQELKGYACHSLNSIFPEAELLWGPLPNPQPQLSETQIILRVPKVLRAWMLASKEDSVRAWLIGHASCKRHRHPKLQLGWQPGVDQRHEVHLQACPSSPATQIVGSWLLSLRKLDIGNM